MGIARREIERFASLSLCCGGDGSTHNFAPHSCTVHSFHNNPILYVLYAPFATTPADIVQVSLQEHLIYGWMGGEWGQLPCFNKQVHTPCTYIIYLQVVLNFINICPSVFITCVCCTYHE